MTCVPTYNAYLFITLCCTLPVELFCTEISFFFLTPLWSTPSKCGTFRNIIPYEELIDEELLTYLLTFFLSVPHEALS